MTTLPYHHGCHSFVGRGCYSALIRLWGTEFRARDQLFITTLEGKTKAQVVETCFHVYSLFVSFLLFAYFYVFVVWFVFTLCVFFVCSVLFEDMKSNTQFVLNEIFEFLHLAPYELTNLAPSNTRTYNQKDIASTEIMSKLINYYKPWNEDLDQTMVEMGFDPPQYNSGGGR